MKHSHVINILDIIDNQEKTDIEKIRDIFDFLDAHEGEYR